MDKLTRKELKSDKFALEVQHSVEYVSEHRQQLIRWGGIAAGVIVLVVAVVVYRNYQHDARQEALYKAMEIQNASVGQSSPNEFLISFPTEADREKAASKAFSDLAAKYPGTDEGSIAEFFLGTEAADRGDLPQAEKRLRGVADQGGTYSANAKLALAEVLAAEGKQADGEKLIQSVIDHPTVLVSKDSATIALARLVGKTDLPRAQKLLDQLRASPRPEVSRAAISVIAELTNK